MIYTFLLAILLEALSSFRTLCVQYFQQRTDDNNNGSRHHCRQWRVEWTRQIVITILYALQTILGYLLMLIVMSYSIELLLSILLGLVVGNGLFVRYSNNNSYNNEDDILLDDNDDHEDDDNEHFNEDNTIRSAYRYIEDQPTNNEALTLLSIGSSVSHNNRLRDGIVRRR
jgi:hypothetical protein